jgi:hypothetical protein
MRACLQHALHLPNYEHILPHQPPHNPPRESSSLFVRPAAPQDIYDGGRHGRKSRNPGVASPETDVINTEYRFVGGPGFGWE